MRRESPDAVAMSVGDRVRWSQVRALWGTVSSLLEAVVTVCGLEKGLGRADGEKFGRVVVVVLALLVPGLRVVREKMGQRLALSSLILSVQLGSAENWVHVRDERSLLRLRCRVGQTVGQEDLLLVQARLASSWNFAGVSKYYLVASSPRPPTCNTSRRRQGHRDYYWGPAGEKVNDIRYDDSDIQTLGSTTRSVIDVILATIHSRVFSCSARCPVA